MKNNQEDKGIHITEEEDGFIGSSPSSIDKQGEKSLRSPSSPKKMSNTNNMNNLNNLILSCVKNEEYCYTMLDYLKKMCHFSQIDYYSAYTQILYCFKPKEM